MTTDTKVELKPCPFCGSEAELDCQEYTDDEDEPHQEWGVNCPKCYVCFPPDSTKALAIDVWNLRQHRATVDVEQLRAALRETAVKVVPNYLAIRWPDIFTEAVMMTIRPYLRTSELNETGLSPRELAEQREELLGVLEDLLTDKTCETADVEDYEAGCCRVCRAKSVSAKAKCEPVLAV